MKNEIYRTANVEIVQPLNDMELSHQFRVQWFTVFFATCTTVFLFFKKKM